MITKSQIWHKELLGTPFYIATMISALVVSGSSLLPFLALCVLAMVVYNVVYIKLHNSYLAQPNIKSKVPFYVALFGFQVSVIILLLGCAYVL